MILTLQLFQDFLAPNTYVYRWKAFVTALKAEFPQLRAPEVFLS
jgi:hypothetical protein